jgi:hypothetical protein
MKERVNLHSLSVALAVVVALACYSLVWSGFKPRVFCGVQPDFSCFYRAGRMVLAGDGARIYDLNTEQRYDSRLKTSFVDSSGHSFSLPFVFAPFVLVVFAPLSLLPYRQSELLWYGINVGMLLTFPFLVWNRLRWNQRTLILALVAPAFFVPVTLALMQGQPTILLLAIFALAFANFAGGNEIGAGWLLALATFKPQLVFPVLLALVAMRKWKTLIAFGTACLLLFGMSVGIVGWRATLAYPRAVIEFSRLGGSIGGEHPEHMPNLRGFLTVSLPSQISSVAQTRIALIATAALLLAMVFRLRRSRQFSPISYSLGLTITLLVSYHAYLHDFALLVLPCTLTADYLLQSKWTMLHTGVAAIVAAFYVIPVAPSSMKATVVQMFATASLLAVLLWMVTEKPETIRR